MENLFRKGDAYAIPFLVKSGDTVIAPANVSGVRIGFANLTASYPDGTLSFDGQCWLFPVEQNQSYGIPVGESEYQVQVQFATGEILSSPRQKVHIDSSIFRQPWGKLELDNNASDAAAVVAQIDPKPQSITAEIQQFSAGTGYVLPPAASDALGGIKADPKKDEDVLPVHIGEDEKAYARCPNAEEVSYVGKIADKNVSTVKAALDTLAIGNYLDMTDDYAASGATSVEQWATMAAEKEDAADDTAATYRVKAGRYSVVYGDDPYYVTIIKEPANNHNVRYVEIVSTSDDGFWYFDVYWTSHPGDIPILHLVEFSAEDRYLKLEGKNYLLPVYDSDSTVRGSVLQINNIGAPGWVLPSYTDIHSQTYTGIEEVIGAINYDTSDLSQRMPFVTNADNGKIAMVVKGKWAAVDLPTYDGGVS